jgi:hypothetical protein
MHEESDEKKALKTVGGTNARVRAMTLPLFVARALDNDD